MFVTAFTSSFPQLRWLYPCCASEFTHQQIFSLDFNVCTCSSHTLWHLSDTCSHCARFAATQAHLPLCFALLNPFFWPLKNSSFSASIHYPFYFLSKLPWPIRETFLTKILSMFCSFLSSFIGRLNLVHLHEAMSSNSVLCFSDVSSACLSLPTTISFFLEIALLVFYWFL